MCEIAHYLVAQSVHHSNQKVGTDMRLAILALMRFNEGDKAMSAYLAFKCEVTGWWIGDLGGWDGWNRVHNVGWARRWTGAGNRCIGLKRFWVLGKEAVEMYAGFCTAS